MTKEWQELYNRAKEVTNPHSINDQVFSGNVGSAVLTKSGNIYTGVCIDTACSLGMCAERNALSTMISNGEFDAQKIVTVDKNGTIMEPCGACREFMMQLSGAKGDIEVLINKNLVLTIKDLMPYQWQSER